MLCATNQDGNIDTFITQQCGKRYLDSRLKEHGIKKEKGKLPVIPFEERMKVVKAIKYVDEVIPQINKNKQRVVDEHNIDAISVGDDWRGRFPKTSCPVEYFTYTESVSSTILKDTLKLEKKA